MMGKHEATTYAGRRLPLDTANYIAELTAEMSSLARRAELERVADLLNLVRLEAEQVVQCGDFQIRLTRPPT